MKSTTSRSVLPALSCSRSWFLRSTASRAFEAAGVVEHDELVGVAVALEPGQRVFARVLVVEADHRRDTGARKLAGHGVLDQAGRTPRSPDVQDPHLAEHVLLREGLVGRIEQ